MYVRRSHNGASCELRSKTFVVAERYIAAAISEHQGEMKWSQC